jgi:hypothetical protein
MKMKKKINDFKLFKKICRGIFDKKNNPEKRMSHNK